MRPSVRLDAVSTHSRPKAAGATADTMEKRREFQHTAARRRLVTVTDVSATDLAVSTHSRPKAAGCRAW